MCRPSHCGTGLVTGGPTSRRGARSGQDRERSRSEAPGREPLHDRRPAPAPWSPTCHRRQGGRVSLSAVVLAGWRLWMETRARGSGSRPWPSVLPLAFAASAWLPGLLGARAHSARVPAACGDGSELDRGPRRPRSVSQDRVAPAHAWSLPCSNHLLSEAPSGEACAAALGRPRWLSGGCLGVGVAGRPVAVAPADGLRGGSATG
jgi:hypothetical protein